MVDYTEPRRDRHWAEILAEEGRAWLDPKTAHDQLKGMTDLDRYLDNQAILNPLIRPSND